MSPTRSCAPSTPTSLMTAVMSSYEHSARRRPSRAGRVVMAPCGAILVDSAVRPAFVLGVVTAGWSVLPTGCQPLRMPWARGSPGLTTRPLMRNAADLFRSVLRCWSPAVLNGRQDPGAGVGFVRATDAVQQRDVVPGGRGDLLCGKFVDAAT